MLHFLDDLRCLLGDCRCARDGELHRALGGAGPMLLVCGREDEALELAGAAAQVGRVTGTLGARLDAATLETYGPHPLVFAPGVGPLATVVKLDSMLDALPPVEWHTGLVITMWSHYAGGVYQVDVLPMAEARTPSTFNRAFYPPMDALWNEAKARALSPESWIDEFSESFRTTYQTPRRRQG